jgi:competence protein ComEA
MKVMRRIPCLFLLTFALGAAQQIPPGAGKDLFVRVCSGCHGLDVSTSVKLSKENWADTVEDMHLRGANGTSAEFEQIVGYLAANFNSKPTRPKINVNKAGAKELVSTLGISPQMAATMVQYREKNGNFKDLSELKKLPGIDAAAIERMKDQIEF